MLINVEAKTRTALVKKGKHLKYHQNVKKIPISRINKN